MGTFVKQFQLPTLSYYYNQIVSLGYDYLSESQIIPLVGEGAIYFPLFIAPFFSACFVWMGVWVDRMVLRAKRLEYRFLAMILALALCCSFGLLAACDNSANDEPGTISGNYTAAEPEDYAAFMTAITDVDKLFPGMETRGEILLSVLFFGALMLFLVL